MPLKTHKNNKKKNPKLSLTTSFSTWHNTTRNPIRLAWAGSMWEACNQRWVHVSYAPIALSARRSQNFARAKVLCRYHIKRFGGVRDESTLVEHLRRGGIGSVGRSSERRRRFGIGEEERLLGLPFRREEGRRSCLARCLQQIQRRRRRQSAFGGKGEERRQRQLDRSDRRRTDAPLLPPRGGCGHREISGLRSRSRQVICSHGRTQKPTTGLAFVFLDAAVPSFLCHHDLLWSRESYLSNENCLHLHLAHVSWRPLNE